MPPLHWSAGKWAGSPKTDPGQTQDRPRIAKGYSAKVKNKRKTVSPNKVEGED